MIFLSLLSFPLDPCVTCLPSQTSRPMSTLSLFLKPIEFSLFFFSARPSFSAHRLSFLPAAENAFLLVQQVLPCVPTLFAMSCFSFRPHCLDSAGQSCQGVFLHSDIFSFPPLCAKPCRWEVLPVPSPLCFLAALVDCRSEALPFFDIPSRCSCRRRVLTPFSLDSELLDMTALSFVDLLASFFLKVPWPLPPALLWLRW